MTGEQQVVVYGTRFCPYCVAARQLLQDRDIPFEDVSLDGELALRREIMARAGRHTVPQIWVGDYHVGGFTDLERLDRTGNLEKLLSAALENLSSGTI